MIQKESLCVNAPSEMVRHRFVNLTKSTDTVTYATAGGAAEAVTISDEVDGKIEIQLLKNLNSTWGLDAAGTIALGGAIKASGTGADAGKGIAQGGSGTILGYAKFATVNGAVGTGYNVS
jgi:hypothetical protein